MEQLTFKSLLARFSFDDILPEFKALYQKLRSDLFEQTDWDIYRDIYQDLRTRKEKEGKSKYAIQINERWGESQIAGSNCCLFYEDGNDYDYRGIGSYPYLSEILGLEIIINGNVALSLEELTAGLLWEITYDKRNGLTDVDLEHLTFKYLLTRFSFDDILSDFKTLYQRNAPKSFLKANWEAYRKVYLFLQQLKLSESKYCIYLASRWEGCSPLIDMNCYIYDKNGDEICQPMATYPIWSEILNMRIIIEYDMIIRPQELTAGLLWEITYYGETDKMIQEHLEKMFK